MLHVNTSACQPGILLPCMYASGIQFAMLHRTTPHHRTPSFRCWLGLPQAEHVGAEPDLKQHMSRLLCCLNLLHCMINGGATGPRSAGLLLTAAAASQPER